MRAVFFVFRTTNLESREGLGVSIRRCTFALLPSTGGPRVVFGTPRFRFRLRKRGIDIRLPPKPASRVTRSIERSVWTKLITMFWKDWLIRYSTAITAARISRTIPKSNSDLCPDPTETESSTVSVADMSHSVLSETNYSYSLHLEKCNPGV